MNFVDRRCKNCGVTLTEFEFKEKSCLCMDCHQEKYNEQSQKTSVLRRIGKKWVIIQA